MQSAIVAILIVVIDQATKLIVVRSLALCERTDLVGNILRITHIRNSGAVFGTMRWAGSYFTLFSIVAGAALIVVIFLARKSSMLVRTALGLVLGGAVGNLIDRLRYGAVVDFMDVGVSEKVRWPCFNVADLAITVGVILLIVNTLRSPKPSTAE